MNTEMMGSRQTEAVAAGEDKKMIPVEGAEAEIDTAAVEG